jgi:ATP-dependent RNA helicase RhlE
LQQLQKQPPSGQRRIRALVLTPTRELAAQVNDSIMESARYLNLKSALIFGGVSEKPQIAKLKQGVDILIATPGRLLDLHSRRFCSFDALEFFVLDEADRMLDMGFIHDIKKIAKLLPRNRQSLFFSATFSQQIRDLAQAFLKDPVEISVATRNTTAASVNQLVCPVDKPRKAALLTHLIESNNWFQVLVFTRTKHGANKLTKYLTKNNIESVAIHGNKSQSARTKALASFKSGDVQVLVATDIASRGLDIDQLPQVVNYELPDVPEDYVHRIGRTGRAGASGEAISLVCQDESKQLLQIERLTKQSIKRMSVDGFESDLTTTPPKNRNRRPKRFSKFKKRR